MPNFQYKAMDKAGKIIQGVMSGDTEMAVADKLKQMEYTPVVIGEAKSASWFEKILNQLSGVSLAELNVFTRQLYVLQKAGMPLLSSINVLKEQADNKTLKDVISQVQRDIEAGTKLSEAFSRHPRVFNNLYVNMIESGETSGRLAEVLERLATLGEHEEIVRLQIKEAVRYPILVVCAIVIAFIVVISFVVPRFQAVFARFGSDLPIPTRVLIWIHFFFTKFWWLALMIIGIIIFLTMRFIRSPRGSLIRDTILLKLPIIGPLSFKFAMSRFGRIAGMLIRSGVPILQILDLTSETVGNVIIKKAILDIKISVSEGGGMSSAMQKSALFPTLVTQMVSVGEQTGKVDELLLHIADYYDTQIDYTIKNLVSLIEPILILILGSFVLLMALGIFMPMWRMIYLFRK